MLLENYVSPWMDEELHILKDAARKFYLREFAPLMPKWEKQGHVDRDAWYKAGEAGILCASIPGSTAAVAEISNMKWFSPKRWGGQR